MRVPVSIVVRMKSASNMIAKWYQYASSVLIPGSPREDARHPDGERDAAARARRDDLARRLARARGAPSRGARGGAKSASSSVVARGSPRVDVVAERGERAGSRARATFDAGSFVARARERAPARPARGRGARGRAP